MAEKKKHKQAKKELKGIRKYLTLRNLLIAAIFIFIYIMFSDIAEAIFFVVIFVPVGILSIKLTRVLPHMDMETLTTCSFFLGYLYGWPVGVFFGLVLGSYIWMTAFSFSQFVMMSVFLNAVAALLGFMFAGYGWAFPLAYMIGMGIRNALYFGVGWIIGGDPVGNTIHTFTAILTNMILLPQLIYLIYNLAVLI